MPKYLGPSQVPTVLGYNKFQTAEQLADNIRNSTKDKDTIFTCKGRYYEHSIVRQYRKHHPDVHVNPNVPFRSKSGIGGFADALVSGDPEGDGGLEVKCQFKYNRERSEPVIYFSYKLQCLAYMYIYNRNWWDLACCRIILDEQDKPVNMHVKVERVYASDFRNKWIRDWLPQLKQFVCDVFESPSSNPEHDSV